MKVAVLSPPEIPIPVTGYGGIERIAQDLAEEIGADLYGSGKALPYPVKDPDQYDAVFDFTHLKVRDLWGMENYYSVPFLTDVAHPEFNVFPTYTVKSYFNTDGPVIYPGIKNIYKEGEPEDYLLFLGRISPIKGVHVAVAVALQSGKRLVIAGHAGKYADRDYVEMIRDIASKHSDLITLREDVSVEEKVELLSHADAVILPSMWNVIGTKESFGITAVEALMSGKPVITSGEGGLGEVVTPDVGFICVDLDDYIKAVKSTDKVDRSEIRKRAEYFSVRRMAEDYLSLIYTSARPRRTLG